MIETHDKDYYRQLITNCDREWKCFKADLRNGDLHKVNVNGENRILKKVKYEDYKRALQNQEIILRICEKCPARVVKYFSFDVFDNKAYILMEYAENGDLLHWLRNINRVPPIELALHFFEQFIEAVKDTQELGINHRDLKSLNAVFDKDWNLKLIDFGGSKIADINDSQSTFICTPAYAAPEKLRYEPFDFSADIWSLGCVAYELFTRLSAFQHPAHLPTSG